MTNLKFLNHASYMCETNDFIFLCDPWLEGTAFNNGWTLLDNSTSNDQILDELRQSSKNIFIWYSHEHSDHFAVPFLKKLKLVRPDAKFFFQTTNDDRVVSFLRNNNFDVKILRDGSVTALSQNSWISVSSWKSGDSLAIMSIEGFTILNINDCIISSTGDCHKLKKLLQDLNVKILDVLFTQFGYASWSGNEDEVEERKAEADEKLKRIGTQLAILQPRNTVLFASFVFFSSEFNFYLNDCQNTPNTVRNSPHLKPYNNDIYFMKPFDNVCLDANISHSLSAITVAAEKHWNDAYSKVSPVTYIRKTCDLKDIVNAYITYVTRVHVQFIGIFALIEVIGRIRPLRVHIIDLDRVMIFSYFNRTKIVNELDEWDIALFSDDLLFSISRDFGFDCTHVNGRLRVANKQSANKFLYFAGPQSMIKQGFGFRKPIKTIKEFIRLAKR